MHGPWQAAGREAAEERVRETGAAVEVLRAGMQGQLDRLRARCEEELEVSTVRYDTMARRSAECRAVVKKVRHTACVVINLLPCSETQPVA